MSRDPGRAAFLALLWTCAVPLEETRLVSLQAFLDESEDNAIFTLAGYVASVDGWLSFTKEWEELLPLGVLNRKGTYQFKMSEMAANEERMARVPAFYRVIEKHADIAISVHFEPSVIQAAMERISVPGARINWKGWTNPYLFAFRALTDVMNMRREELGSILRADEKIDFIFDRRFEEKRIRRAWEAVRNQLPPEKSRLYGATPCFEDDEEFLPLQAADFWAWWIRKWRAEHGESAASRGKFPWDSDINKPPKIDVTFDEDGAIEYLLDKGRSRLPEGRQFVVASRS